MKNKFIEAEQIGLSELQGEWVSLNLGGESFVMDLDTLYDMSFRFASLLALMESRLEDSSLCLCESSSSGLH